jgi:hypothetical protein
MSVVEAAVSLNAVKKTTRTPTHPIEGDSETEKANP